MRSGFCGSCERCPATTWGSASVAAAVSATAARRRRSIGGTIAVRTNPQATCCTAAAAAAGTLALVSRQDDYARAPVERWLIALAALALWAIVPPYLGPVVGLELDVPSSVEVVDHVVPGVAACAGALIALAEARRGALDGIRALAALGVCVLAGLFQAVSHA